MNSYFQSDLDKVPYLVVNNGKVIEISQAFVDFTGFLPEEFLSKNISEIFRILKIVYEPNADDSDNKEYFLFTKSLQIRLVNIFYEKYSGNGVYYFNEIPDSNIAGKIQTINDVTDKVLNKNKILEQTKIIEQQKKQFEAVFENMADGCIIFDKEKRIISINKIAKSWFLGISLDSMDDFLKGIFWYDMENRLIDYEELPSTKVISGKKFDQAEILMKSGDTEKVLNISGTPIYDEKGNFNIGVLTASDITEQTKYKKAIKIQNDYLYRMIDILNLPIIRVSYPELNIVGINIKGYDFAIGTVSGDINSLNSIIGEKIDKLFKNVNFEPFKICIDSMIKDGNPSYLKDMCITINCKKSYYNFIFQPVSVTDMEIQEFVIICIDITDEVVQKQAAEEVMMMQQEFFTYITHEFKTPLTSMSSTIQILELLHSDEMNENLKKNIYRLKRNIFQQLRLVNNLLDIIKAESGYLKVYKNNYDIVQLTRVIAESIYEFARAKDIKINYNFLVGSKIIAVDDEKYERIILNLLSNAIKYTPNGRTITITISEDRGMIYIAVKDEGVGIPKDKYESLFKRFGQVGSSLTRYSEGTGIGLCLVKLLVKAMDGEISFTSEEGIGTTFIVSLPDMKANDNETVKFPQMNEGRLIRTMNVEFSNIYLE